ncbi:RBBP9/YdeN family alpha/beta hydrolase [Noviherbaspirillum sp.]|uniref:RBBP9/YdeN family alpha/beta hydrolase n=1 Tax=Noviherbaspirillum sp. TaxID=1926288 RepID=UPI002FE01739
MSPSIILVPGINNSGPTHWQTLWEQSAPSFRRIEVDDWDHPVCATWIASIDHAVAAAKNDVILVAHSLGCLPVIEWATQRYRERVVAAMLVSVPDPAGPNFPKEASGFSMPSLNPLPLKSLVVSSEDDPYGAPGYARTCASAWGSRFVNVGNAGHINTDSRLGTWEQGMTLLRSLM